MVLLVVATERVVLDVPIVTIGRTGDLVGAWAQVREDRFAIAIDLGRVTNSITGKNELAVNQMSAGREIMHVQHDRAAAAGGIVLVWRTVSVLRGGSFGPDGVCRQAETAIMTNQAAIKMGREAENRRKFMDFEENTNFWTDCQTVNTTQR